MPPFIVAGTLDNGAIRKEVVALWSGKKRQWTEIEQIIAGIANSFG